MTGDSSGKTHSRPLLGEEDAKHGHVGTSEIPRISWRRAIGVFHLYMAWLIAELVGLYVKYLPQHKPREECSRTTRRHPTETSSPGKTTTSFVFLKEFFLYPFKASNEL